MVDDEYINRDILENLLEKYYEVSFAENGLEAMKMLRSRETNFSLVLLDLLMPEMDGFEVIQQVREDEVLRNIPIIVMTSEKDAEVKSIKLGTVDFITKPYDMPEVILARCERIIKLSEDQSIITSAEKDDLTGLYARDFYIEYIRQIEKFNEQAPKDVVAINVDHFHIVNEVYGRDMGDSVLVKMAVILQEMFDEITGIGCRLEPDIFYVYCSSGVDYEDMFNRLQVGLAELENAPHIRFRMGIYKDVDKNVAVEEWIDRAKMACDQIRGDYSKHISYYSVELHDKSLYQERLINDIQTAVQNHDFVVYYQPKYAIQGNEPVLRSAEALIRWKHPELGMISPGDFIPLFESNGLI